MQVGKIEKTVKAVWHKTGDVFVDNLYRQNSIELFEDGSGGIIEVLPIQKQR